MSRIPCSRGLRLTGKACGGKKVPLVENGVVKRVVYARATAERMKRSEYKDRVGPIEPTGHGFLIAQRDGRDAAEYRVRADRRSADAWSR